MCARSARLAGAADRPARLARRKAGKREGRGQPELGVAVIGEARQAGPGTAEGHVRRQFPVQRGELAAGRRRARSWSKPAGRPSGFLPPTSASLMPAVTTPTPWLSASWLPKQESHGTRSPVAENSRSARCSSPG